MDCDHELRTRLLDGNLFLAPIPEPHRVLDIGTGTGIWAIDFADQFPSAEVIGIDLSPIQPDMVPPNLRFQIDDIRKEWSFRYKFDFIYIRDLLVRSPLCLNRKWSNIIATSTRALLMTGLRSIGMSTIILTRAAGLSMSSSRPKSNGNGPLAPPTVTPTTPSGL